MIIPSFPEEDNATIYTQLAEELNKKHNINVVTSVVKKGQKTNIYKTLYLHAFHRYTELIEQAQAAQQELEELYLQLTEEEPSSGDIPAAAK